jgi:RNA polymerase sigma-70 factor (ECF subfamily)
VLQTTYLKILDGKAVFNGRSTPKTWLFAVIRRTAAERRRRALLRAVGLAPPFEPAEAPGPDALLGASQEARRVIEALKLLSARQREVLELVFYQELTVEAAAGVMGVSVGSARVHYDRGKRRLLEELGGADAGR